MDVDALLARVTSTASLFVATDFDGTISDITNDPEGACGRDDAFAALARLASARGVHVAVVSGRDLPGLRARTSVLGAIYRVAEHGAFIEAPDGHALASSRGASIDGLDALARRAEELASRVSGMRAERKARGVALHVREVEAASRGKAEEVLAVFRSEAPTLGLDVMDGRQVVEARDPSASKRVALERVIAELPEASFVVYAGDDTTDECAIELVRQRGGVGIYVASPERPKAGVEADLVLAGPPAWAELLTRIADARASFTGRATP